MNSSHQRQPLNPFVLSTETNSLFVLLVVSAVLFVVGLTTMLGVAIQLSSVGLQNIMQLQNDVGTSSSNSVALQPLLLSLYCLVIFAFIAVFVGAFMIYRRSPERLIERLALEHFPPERDQQFASALSDIAETVNVNLPTVYIEPQSVDLVDGQVWGVRRRKFLRITTGLRLTLRKNSSEFAAIIHHELAHIANGDVGRTYLTQSLWKALLIFFGAMVAIFTIGGIYSAIFVFPDIIPELQAGDVEAFNDPRIVLFIAGLPIIFLVQQAGLFLVIAILRASILRTREYYADWRAAHWGSKYDLITLIQDAPDQKTSIWLRPFLPHPSKHKRMESLHDPDHLFKISYLVVFLLGMIVTYTVYSAGIVVVFGLTAVFNVSEALATFSPVSTLDTLLSLGSTVIAFVVSSLLLLGTAALVESILGTQIQRQTILDLKNGRHGMRPYVRLLIPAIVFTVGVFGTAFLALGVFSLPSWFQGGNDTRLLTTITAAIGLIIVTWLMMFHTRFFSLRAFGTHQGSKVPKFKSRMIKLSSTYVIFLAVVSLLSGPIANLVYSTVSVNQALEESEFFQNPDSFSEEELESEVLPFLLDEVQSEETKLPDLVIALISIGSLLILYLGSLAIFWAISKSRRVLFASSCKSCKRSVSNTFDAVNCASCGAHWSSWAYTEQ